MVDVYDLINGENYKPELLKVCEFENGNINFLDEYELIDFLNMNLKIDKLTNEHIYIVSLNLNGDICSIGRVACGTHKNCTYDMRTLAILLLLSGAEQFYVIHNHPNGSLEISNDDMIMTLEIKNLSNLLDIKLIEHIIISSKGFNKILAEEDVCYEW